MDDFRGKVYVAKHQKDDFTSKHIDQIEPFT